GSTNTVNVAGYTIGEGFKVWNVPAMRLIVDFSLAEPLYLVNAGGQSGNPASRHYDDGIPLYLSGENRSLAFHAPVLVSQQFNRTLILQPAACRRCVRNTEIKEGAVHGDWRPDAGY
ncbi:MAG: penicillin acylase family protein, partial [Moraxellaceae bacterium]|nr:penicillin acylase family protein [Moraxellaceae bacterium]